MSIISNEKSLMIVQSTIILSTVFQLALAFDQCDIRGKFTNAKGKFI